MEVNCAACGVRQSGVFCTQCGAVLPFQEDLDYFTLLGQERRPVLDEGRLRETYRRLSQRLHPDRFHSRPALEKALALQWSSLLNQAYFALKDPKERLRYLVELETGVDRSKPREKTVAVSGSVMGLFERVRSTCQQVDEFLQSCKPAATSRIAAAALAADERGHQHRRRLEAIKGEVERFRSELLAEVRRIDEQWVGAKPEARGALASRLSHIVEELTYLSKFDSLVDERLFNLGLHNI